MKKLLAFLLIAFSFALHAQFEDLATVEFSIQNDKEDVYELSFKIKLNNGAHLYGPSNALIAPPELILNLDSSPNYKLLNDWEIPEFKTKYVKEFDGDVTYFDGKELVATRLIKGLVKDFSVTGDYQAQVCNKGRCITSPFPNPKFKVKVGNGDKFYSNTLPLDNISENETNKYCGYDFSKEENKLKTFQGKLLDSENDSSFWNTFFVAFLFGLGAILTPCVFPMIPMTVSFFLKGDSNGAKGKITALIFGFSIIVIYCLIGSIISAVFGPEAASLISTHWLPNLLFFAVFIFFAASFLGMFEITLPSKWSNISDKKADKGGIIGAIFMALTLALVSFSCTGPIIGTVLVESFKVGGLEPLIGMLGFSTAFALPFTFFAFFPSWLKSLPKSGGWLNSVKVVFGFLELALALKFLSVADLTGHWGVLDRDVYLALWIVIFSLLGFYLLGKIKFAHDSDLKYVKVPRLILAIGVFSFVVYLLPGMWGAPLRALSGYLPPMTTMDYQFSSYNTASQSEICDKPSYSDDLHLPLGLRGYYDWEEGMCCSKEQGKPVFIDFTGHACTNCREIENLIWADPEILEFLKKEFVIISLFTDDRKIKIKDPYIAVFDGKTRVKYVGQKAYDIQKTWFNKVAQPYYVTMDQNKELLEMPIDYEIAENKSDFMKFLKLSLKEYKKRNP